MKAEREWTQQTNILLLRRKKIPISPRHEMFSESEQRRKLHSGNGKKKNYYIFLISSFHKLSTLCFRHAYNKSSNWFYHNLALLLEGEKICDFFHCTSIRHRFLIFNWVIHNSNLQYQLSWIHTLHASRRVDRSHKSVSCTCQCQIDLQHPKFDSLMSLNGSSRSSMSTLCPEEMFM